MALAKKNKKTKAIKIKVKASKKAAPAKVKKPRAKRGTGRAPRNSGIVTELTRDQRNLIARLDANEAKIETAREEFQRDLAALMKLLGGARTFDHPEHGLFTIMSGRNGDSLFWRKKPVGRAA